jgi:hypothetical protein
MFDHQTDRKTIPASTRDLVIVMLLGVQVHRTCTSNHTAVQKSMGPKSNMLFCTATRTGSTRTCATQSPSTRTLRATKKVKGNASYRDRTCDLTINSRTL